MISTPQLKNLIMLSIIISYVAMLLELFGILRYPFGETYGTVTNIGSIIGLIFAIVAIRLVLIIPEK
ncbi:MAG: hypothetical protein QW597_06820 [Thermoplasmataceae archaeon]